MAVNICITGAGGFIGGHLVKALIEQGHKVRAVDIKQIHHWHQFNHDADNWRLDLRLKHECVDAVRDMDWVFNLAADMGGMGFITAHKADCMMSVLINTHMLMAAKNEVSVERYFFSSSACVYPDYKQNHWQVQPLKESDVYPAMPENGYGWEKLFGERLCRHFWEDFGLKTRVARYHNVYGPYGTWKGGREKAPSAICRKVIEAKLNGKNEIEIWGTGEQTRSFMYVDDCIKGTEIIMRSDVDYPVNLGSSELVSINQLVDLVEEIAEVKLKRIYKTDAPVGVHGRNSDNTLIQSLFGWQPSIKLREGLEKTYEWIYGEMTK